jgi:hypothetical protein
VRWIPAGYLGAGNLTVFSNRNGPEDAQYSAVYEIAPPTDSDGNYIVPEEEAFGPAEPVWAYTATNPNSWLTPFISGASRLASGNTLVNSGPHGRFFEVTPDGEIIWEYRDPYAVFRATPVPADHPALAGRMLVPLDPQPEIPPPAEDDEKDTEDEEVNEDDNDEQE